MRPGYKLDKNEMGEACSTNGWKVDVYKGFWWGNLRGRDHLAKA